LKDGGILARFGDQASYRGRREKRPAGAWLLFERQGNILLLVSRPRYRGRSAELHPVREPDEL